MKRLLPALSLFLALLPGVPASAQTRPNVVTSFSILADFARRVGGDRISVTSLVGPDSDAHVYTPTPHDAKDVGAARLLIVNGLGLEGWLPRLQQASGSKAPIIVATQGITPRKRGADADPHAWQSVGNARVYVRNIRDALVAADPADAAVFQANAERYLAELDALDQEVRAEIGKIPPERRKVISTHDAFGYFADAYGIQFIAPLGVSTETEPSARDVAEIIVQVRKDKIPAVFLENFNDDRLVGRIAAETGAKIGGTLYSDALSEENGPAPTYIAMVRHNIRALTSALGR
ncbi:MULTISPECIES: metal ABC transporter substrate-binding protein [Bradyrhizobium]|jgi:zinc/manganese transport system substrate-binding protein|uniref:metal ABC transporter substrate-binding protein n=1 Tax=Bradyrhizobium TaxID=374 RepID=UPI0003A2E649|nr:metal ABC transporter substrate-binding protein [Bradyrhizobium denitrificans]MCL8487182.1 metal ABC transporter substrate-binding protein [Bradyrhizobium denitrificans]RTL98170.1 MAG: metal ABC transporter substrate-binding protein [Bradyrhizobiaceae bacterium]